MSSSIFGDSLSTDVFGAEYYPSEAEIAAKSESIRALSTRIVSALFAANIPPSMIATAALPEDSKIRQVVVIGRTLGRLPSSILDLIGIDHNGATAQVVVVPATEREFARFQRPDPTSRRAGRAEYGASIPAVVFSVGPSDDMNRQPHFFRETASY